MSQTPEQIGPYTIASEIGRGGMGVVYLAHDTRLDRDVAIKTLPEHLAQDPERLARFEREARTLASLNHPNVAGIHAIEEVEGNQYLILEYVEGHTLQERLDRGPLPIDDAIEIAIDIARGIETAHEAAIIHRDLKPANIKVTPDGSVKVLDFGLARSVETASSSSMSQLPTLTSPAMNSPTMPGVIMGTAAYMSPEQARGRTVDKRSDIWSFGVVLYEMLTGVCPFAGETISDSIGAILHKPADLNKLPPTTPPMVRHVLTRCLQRDKNTRYRDIGDVRIELESLADEHHIEDNGSPKNRRRPPVIIPLLLVALVSVSFLYATSLTSSPSTIEQSVEPVRFSIGGFNMPNDGFASLAISPDGSKIVLRKRDHLGATQLNIRHINSIELEPIAGTENGWMPFFSPDGQSIAYFTAGILRRTSLQTGISQDISVAHGGFAGGTWMPDDTILFTDVSSDTFKQVSIRDGEITILPVSYPQPIRYLASSSRLGDNNDLVICSVRTAERDDPFAAIYDRTTHQLTTIQENAYQPVYANSGHILYQQGQAGPLMALPFDVNSLQATSDPFILLPDIGSRVGSQAMTHTIAENGTLAYISPFASDELSEAYWLDSEGNSESIFTVSDRIDTPRISPDGTKIAFRVPSPSCNIWVHDIERGITTMITRADDNHGVVWTNDSQTIYTYVNRSTDGETVAIRMDGLGEPQPVHEPQDRNSFTSDLSSDGRYLLLAAQRADTGNDVDLVDLQDGSFTTIIGASHNELAPSFNNDDSLIAYVSNETGRNEVYIQTFPSLDRRVQISSGGGNTPVWSPDGKWLNYTQNAIVFRVSISTDPSLQIGRPAEHMINANFEAGRGLTNFDIASDGRLLFIRDNSETPEANVEVMLNVFDEIQRIQSNTN